jgi:hypothetical protein
MRARAPLPVQMVLTRVADGELGDLRLQCPKTRSPALPAEIDVSAGRRLAFPGAKVVRGPVEASVAEQALKRGHLQFPHYSG